MKTYKKFLIEAAKVIGMVKHDFKYESPNKKTVTMFNKRKNKKKDYSFDPNVIEAYNKADRIFSKYAQKHNKKLKLNRLHFVESHMAQRIHERVESVDNFIAGVDDVLRNTDYIDDLQVNYEEFDANRGRKLGPQMISHRYKIHIGTEVNKRGKVFDIIFKSVMGDWSLRYIHGLRDKTRLYQSK
jgi:hypothetical protein